MFCEVKYNSTRLIIISFSSCKNPRDVSPDTVQHVFSGGDGAGEKQTHSHMICSLLHVICTCFCAPAPQVLPIWELAIPLPAVLMITVTFYMIIVVIGLWIRFCLKVGAGYGFTTARPSLRSRESQIHNQQHKHKSQESVFCLPKDQCSPDCGDCCPDLSLSEQCFRLAEMCNCKLPTLRSCVSDMCPSPTVSEHHTLSLQVLLLYCFPAQ